MIDTCASPEQFAQRIRAANTIFRIGWGVSANGHFLKQAGGFIKE
jgi:hypothetical protein